jgi:hypothetical protein
MMRFVIALCAATSLLLVGGCATITKGTTESITFNSEPAGAIAQTSIGLQCPATPCTFEVPRKQDFIVTFSKPGFESQQVPVNTKLAGSGAAGFAGNVLLGGVVGMGVDAATGSTLDHFPNPVFVTLRPGAAASGAVVYPPATSGKNKQRRSKTPPPRTEPEEEPVS